MKIYVKFEASTFCQTRSGFSRCPIVLNGKPVASLGPQTYIVLNLDPGQHTLVADTDDGSELQLTVFPGKNYYVKYSLTLWLNTVSGKLVMVDEREGKSLVTASKRAATASDFK
jgi:hypothetical protein